MEPVLYEHKVQYYETDKMDWVHHSNYIRWFEEARTDLLEQMGMGYDRIEALGIGSPVLGVEADRVNVKATTEEHLGFTGDGSGMAAHAVALLERIS